jgi:hypothetical protein
MSAIETRIITGEMMVLRLKQQFPIKKTFKPVFYPIFWIIRRKKVMKYICEGWRSCGNVSKVIQNTNLVWIHIPQEIPTCPSGNPSNHLKNKDISAKFVKQQATTQKKTAMELTSYSITNTIRSYFILLWIFGFMVNTYMFNH